MTRYLVYDMNTGEIKRTGMSTREALGLQANAPEDMVVELKPEDGDITDASHFIDLKSGKPILKPPAAAPTAAATRKAEINGLIAARIASIMRRQAVADLLKDSLITATEAVDVQQQA